MSCEVKHRDDRNQQYYNITHVACDLGLDLSSICILACKDCSCVISVISLISDATMVCAKAYYGNVSHGELLQRLHGGDDGLSDVGTRLGELASCKPWNI